jgi:hypothetical protein
MSHATWGRIRRWAGRCGLAALLAAVVLPLAAFTLDRGRGVEVLLIAPHDPAMVALNRSLFSPGDPVAEIYGNPMSQPVRVLLAGRTAVLHPQEDPALALLPVETGGRRPLQIRTLWWATRLGVAGLGALSLVAFAVTVFARRREQRGPAAAPAAASLGRR